MDTQLLGAADLDRAAQILKDGGLVGLPTETVYGLGANGLDSLAVQNIFRAKGRPQDNPLILHIPDASWLSRYCREIPDTAYALAQTFWPGPLTMILGCREDMIPKAVTAGLATVGMRCPAHNLTRQIIALAGVPVAAPSGNTSGRPSPTTAQSMLGDMGGKIDAIVDGGACQVGLESTIIDLTVKPPRLLRPGGVTLEQLRDVLGEIAVDEAVVRPMQPDETPRAPGMKYRHYAPKAPVTVVTGPGAETAAYLLQHAGGEDGIICFSEYQARFPQINLVSLGSEHDLAEQGRRLFSALRHFDQTEVKHIWAQCPQSSGLGFAIANRLKKAAGFHIVEV